MYASQFYPLPGNIRFYGKYSTYKWEIEGIQSDEDGERGFCLGDFGGLGVGGSGGGGIEVGRLGLGNVRAFVGRVDVGETHIEDCLAPEYLNPLCE